MPWWLLLSSRFLNLHVRVLSTFQRILSAENFITAHAFAVIDVVFPVLSLTFQEMEISL